MVVKALSDPNHDREMEVKIDGSHFVTFSIARNRLAAAEVDSAGMERLPVQQRCIEHADSEG